MRWIYSGILFFMMSLNASDNPQRFPGESTMSDHVFVVSEWLPKEGKDQELWQHAKRMMALTLKEEGCVRAHATRQIVHPGAPEHQNIRLYYFKNIAI